MWSADGLHNDYTQEVFNWQATLNKEPLWCQLQPACKQPTDAWNQLAKCKQPSNAHQWENNLQGD